MHAYTTSSNVPRLDIPATSELFSKEALVERHPNLLTYPRVQWALRNRARNGLSSAVYESKSGQLLVHEPEFLRWYLGLTGRSKPRASRVLRRSTGISVRGLNRHKELISMGFPISNCSGRSCEQFEYSRREGSKSEGA